MRVSPLIYASRQARTMLLIHGSADPIVPLEESERFHEALLVAGATARLRIVEGGSHNWFAEELEDVAARFFTQYLKH